MIVLLITIGLVALFFVLMSVRLIFIKGGEFRGTCASSSPWVAQNGSCSYCGKPLDQVGGCGAEEAQASDGPAR